MTWQLAFNRYIHAPRDAWPRDKPLQARKLEEYSARQCESADLSLARLAEQVWAAARRRTRAGTPTLFLVNCGSSGSHWVEAMLSQLPGVHACGEVYVPPQLGSELQQGRPQDRATFLDALHQVHVENAARTADTDVLINSAHSWNPHDLMGDTAVVVGLVRDPLDVAMSRTFRKPKLRRHLTQTASDAEYLDTNIAMVEKFYRSMLRRKPAHMVRYEDVRDRAVEPLGRLASLLGRPTPPERLEAIAASHSAGAQSASGRRLSNVYRGGEAPVPPGLFDHATRRLERIRKDLGYA
ncbi:sulfotransferase domain-containing protein [Luteimonas lutimaris]|uniref:Sulfotransferase domain-containing protein n=1 Tax=Luteimonas lutimaris TaxID=698645 RepID=A0ABP7MYD6_9GAMM